VVCTYVHQACTVQIYPSSRQRYAPIVEHTRPMLEAYRHFGVMQEAYWLSRAFAKGGLKGHVNLWGMADVRDADWRNDDTSYAGDDVPLSS
jgi:hypothetical protein